MTDPTFRLNADGSFDLVIDSGATSARLLAAASGAIHREPIDEVLFPPSMTGAHGRAWLCDLAVGRRRLGFDASIDGTIAHWVVEAPWAHPVWHSYSIVLVHLRDIVRDGQLIPTIKYIPGCTHEFWVYALDPSKARAPMIETGIPHGHWMTPLNFAAQMIVASDAEAVARLTATTQSIIDGLLSPDTDAAADWRSIWGEAMVRAEYR